MTEATLTKKVVYPALSVLLVDGSALFFGQRAFSPDRNMDYGELLNLLQSAKTFPSSSFQHAYYFTASDQQNEKQAKFHEMIANLGYKVVDFPPHEAVVNNPLLSEQNTARVTRFDALISYSLGRLAASASQGLEAFIVTDSYPVALAVREAAAKGAMMTIAFFGSCIDTRWNRVFRDHSGPGGRIKFIDLEMSAPRLFQRTRAIARKDVAMLGDLP